MIDVQETSYRLAIFYGAKFGLKNMIFLRLGVTNLSEVKSRQKRCCV